MRIFKRKKDKEKKKIEPLNPRDLPTGPKVDPNVADPLGISDDLVPELDGDFELPFEGMDSEEFDDVFEDDIVDEDSDDYS